MKATSWGVGEMIMNAYRRGVRHFIVGLGGSATSDCGIGMLKAMGDDWKKIRQECSFVLASDVTNPLCGENGAAHVFAPQKGADAKMVQMLDDRARKFAEVSSRHFGYDRSEVPGAGAGSTVMAYASPEADCERIAKAMVDVFAANNEHACYHILDLDTDGVKKV